MPPAAPAAAGPDDWRLDGFCRSRTAHRLRTAFNLKGLPYRQQAVDLRLDEPLEPPFKAVNPQGLVPARVVGSDVLIQSPAILEGLEERHPQPPLLPADPDSRARVRALAAIVGCDIHPLNNRRVLQRLRKTWQADRFKVDLNRWPLIQSVDLACSALPAVQRAATAAQPAAA